MIGKDKPKLVIGGEIKHGAALRCGKRLSADKIARCGRNPALSIFRFLCRIPARRVVKVQIRTFNIRLPPARERHRRVLPRNALHGLPKRRCFIQCTVNKIHAVRIDKRGDEKPRFCKKFTRIPSENAAPVDICFQIVFCKFQHKRSCYSLVRMM